MSKRQVLMILGVLVMILLFLGFPSSWEEVIALVIGACVIAVSYSLARPQDLKRDSDPRITYVEHKSEPVIPLIRETEPVPPSPVETAQPITNGNPPQA